MQDVYYESTAFGDVLVDENGDPLAIVFESSGVPSGGSGVWKDPVQAVTDLPADGNAVDDIRLVRSAYLFYVWDGDSWEIVGEPVPSQWKDSVLLVDDLPTIGNAVGDSRLVRSVRRIYMWDGAAWQILSDTVGGGGTGGIPMVEYRTDLDAIENPTLGDMYLVRTETAIYVYDEVMVDKAPVPTWVLLHAQADIKLKLNDELPWLELDGDTAGSFQIRSRDADENYDMQTDPGLVTEGYSGLNYYPPDANGPGGYEPARHVSNWDLYQVRKETRTVLAKKAWDISAWGTVEHDYVFNGLHSLAVTLGRPGYEGFSTLYGMIDRTTNTLRFGRVSGVDQGLTFGDLESVAFLSPPAGYGFYLWMYRAGDVITLYAEASDPADSTTLYSAEVTHVVDADDSWMQPSEGLYPGFGSQWGDVNYGHRFTGAKFKAPDAWRELVLRLKSADASSPTELILADTRAGWLLMPEVPVIREGHAIEFLPSVGALDPLPQRGKLQFASGGGIVGLSAFDGSSGNPGGGAQDNTTTVAAWIDTQKLKDETKKTVKETKGETTGFVTLGLEAGLSQPELETDPEVPGPRYKCSYQFDNGWTNFRGFFESGSGGSGKIGNVLEEFRPPHTVRGVGVREDGTLFSVYVDPNGDIYCSSFQSGRNHLDGFRYYKGKGPMEVEGTFIPDPDDPYRAYQSGNSFFLVGAGLFEDPRSSDEGELFLPPFPPIPPDGGWDGWYFNYNPPTASFTWLVISGPDVGQSGTVTYGQSDAGGRFESGPNGDYGGFIVGIPSGLDGEVRVTFHNVRWELGYVY